MKEYKIAIIGGHGLVAITLLKLLCNSFYKDSDIYDYAYSSFYI